MTETNGSRWYFPIFEGLIDAKHQAQMGRAIWLYLYCVKYAFVAEKGGNLRYNHLEAAKELGTSPMTVKRWFKTLQEHGYVQISARKPYHLEVQVTNWRTVEEWHEARQRDERGPPIERSNRRSNRRSNKIVTSNTLSISLSCYVYPNGSQSDDPAQTSLADAFRGLVNELKITKNRAAALRQIYKLCFGGPDESLPDYGFLGKAAKAVGGAERLAMLMWEHTTRPPVDPLPYIIKVYGNGGPHAPTYKRPADQTGNNVPGDYYVADPIDPEESERIRAEIHASLDAERVGPTGGVP